MPMSRPRYAIYFTPPPASDLWRFGCAALGYDPRNGELTDAERGPFAEIMPRRFVAEPSQYGFHATLRAPFELAPTASRESLLTAATTFAARHRPVAIGPLRLAVMDTFIALVPVEQTAQLSKFAGGCVEFSEPHRAPLGPIDRARRLKAALTHEQIALLDRWGYPYVFDQFKFHMSLTGKLEPADSKSALDALQAHYAAIDEPVTLDAITVLVQPARDQRFHVIARLPLNTSL
jgi:hypothetical protein